MLFELFKSALKVATTSAAFKASNLLIQDVDFSAGLQAHLSVLSADYNIRLTAADVLSVASNATNDEHELVVEFGELGEGAEIEDNYVTFNALIFPVAISLGGYIAQSSLVGDELVVEYRSAEALPWHKLEQLDNVPGSKYLQFRARPSAFASDGSHTLKKLLIVGRQE